MKIKLFIAILAGILIILISSCSESAVEEEVPVDIITIPATIADEPIQTSEISLTEPVADDDEYDPYEFIRFGETRDILLLDIEWHTPETYAEHMENTLRWLAGEVSAGRDTAEQYDFLAKSMENDLELMKEGKLYCTMNVNGHFAGFSISKDDSFDIYEYHDADGYYIFHVYPYNHQISYTDENGVFQWKLFDADSREKWDILLANEIIPFCDELLAKGLITQEQYEDYTISDPLDYYVDLYFN